MTSPIKQTIEHIVHAKWIISGDSHLGLLEHHSMIVDHGVIIDILPTDSATQLYHASHTHDYTDHAVMPGFVNAHTHLGMNFFRGLGSDHSLMEWLEHYMWPAEKKWLDHDFVYDASRFAMAEMIKSGTTCFNDMFYFMPATADAALSAGMRAYIGMHIIGFPNTWAETTDACFSKGLEFYEQYKHHPLITPTIATHAPYSLSDEPFVRAKEMADQLNMSINIHLHETMDEINQSLMKTNKRPIKRLYDLDFLSPDVIAIHAVHLNQDDLDILCETQVNIVHCPESNMKLASGICPVAQLKSRHLNVALGTDSVASNNDLDMIGEMRSATFLSKIATMDALSLTAAETIELATLNGAKALQMDHLFGSLKPGKAADFIAINLNTIETLPVYDPMIQVVYSCGPDHVTDVWVAGKQLMKNRILLTLDEEELKAKARFWGQKIKQ